LGHSNSSDLISDHKDDDEFFMNNIWGRQDREMAQELAMDVLNAFVL